MERDTDDRKKPQLKLVVNNAEKRSPRPAEPETPLIPLEELLANRNTMRDDFYRGMTPQLEEGYRTIERFLDGTGWQYGLDPHHGRPVVLPAGTVCPRAAEVGSPQDEILLFMEPDGGENGLCLALEMILPFGSDDDAEMESALLYGTPVLQYGTIFLDENPHDGMLDLVYRLAMPILPPELSTAILERIMIIAGLEIGDAIQSLAE